MEKKSKKKGIGTVGLVLLGVGIAVFGSRIFGGLVDKYVNGLSFMFSGVKFKIQNFKLIVTGKLTIANQNKTGGSFNGFSGSLKYGRNGQQIAPVNVQGFPLPAQSSGSTTFISEIPIANLVGNLINVVNAIIDGSLKKLWLTGSLNTTFINIPVDTEISVLSE